MYTQIKIKQGIIDTYVLQLLNNSNIILNEYIIIKTNTNEFVILINNDDIFFKCLIDNKVIENVSGKKYNRLRFSEITNPLLINLL